MKKKVLIVGSDYYEDIANALLDSTKKFLNKKIKFNIIKVPGVFEIPIIISKNINKFDGFVAIGCVIKGKTAHFDLISKSVIDGRTFSTMNVLNKDNRPLEIARMLSGDETSEISIKHAKSLLNEN